MQPNSFTFNDTLTSESSSSKNMSRSGREIFLKIILAILAAVFVVEFIWLVLISPSRPLREIEINGIPGVERNYILHHSGITNQTSFFSVNTAKMENLLEELYMVASAQVVKQFPDKIYIKLNPRIPVAVSLALIDGESTPLFIDKHGVVCKIGISDSESKMQANNLPIISGLIFNDVRLGTRLPVLMRGVLESVEHISVNNPMLLSLISEIRMYEKNYGGFEMVLYPSNSNVRVRIGSELSEDTIKYMMLMIDVVKKTGAEIDEIDFRTGTASYKVKEALNG